ncbi:3-oxoacyl-ACP reductase [Cytobacillus purgationiresistens]|uniref:3-oxoacyl-[acyl-carrier protein] reductase n=1 Tax=Cytobacillus purgationiresistens TaxID=863449 RepID=A0ABU0AH53_9BACI|nr:3-oxoacyl-ACP reductase [Cytobacillus purgationiresistens]MDQ0270595.1 3-oxoacyl-[acyl-carrier protein] reductase [Cytobacillus purgationiresistens]
MKNKVVLVTGGSRGLGAAIARKFGQQGYFVIVNYIHSQHKAESVAAEIGNDHAMAIRADVRDRAEVEKMVTQAEERFGPIDIVVNNALVNFKFDPIAQASVEDLTWDQYNEQLEGAVKASLNVIQSVLPALKESSSGRVIQIGTNLFQNPVVAYHQYTTAKAALIGFTRNMAKELGQYGITVNMVSGGLLETTDASAVTTPEVFALVAGSSALQRVTQPEDVAEMVAFLASTRAKAVTGQNIVVDNGLTMN